MLSSGYEIKVSPINGQFHQGFPHLRLLPNVPLPHKAHRIDNNFNIERDPLRQKQMENLRQNLDRDIIGSEAGFWGPFGWRKYTYLDHTASGKSVNSIEDFIENQVLPHYANTHTTVSHTSLQTTIFRNEARNIIKHAVGASDDDEVIFCGSGSTAAVHKLVHSVSYPKSRKLIAFIGPFEHHSNVLPWREAAAKVIQVPMNPMNGQVDVEFLRINLKTYTTVKKKKNHLVIGCFSAGSNITGSVTDDIEITKLLHEHGALAFWDYAAAAPHVNIRMNPVKCSETRRPEDALFGHYANWGTEYEPNKCKLAWKDAIFFSGHKFLGGPQTPGVLVVKKHVLQNPVPHGMGGGTVLFTTKQAHQYLEEPHEREEGGTPDIVGSIRLGLVFRLRNLVGVQNIVNLEATFCRQTLNEWSRVPEIQILGLEKTPRLPCISFMIKHIDTDYFLHHSFIVSLLNDLFGIQCRGGCMCAGPYAQSLLGIDDKLAAVYQASLKNYHNSAEGAVLKPGFVRISLSFHSSQEDVKFVIKAVKLVARYGWRLLPFYKMNLKTASFVHNGDYPTYLSSLTAFDKTVTSVDTACLSLSENDIKINPMISSSTVPVTYTNSRVLHHAKTLMTSDLSHLFHSLVTPCVTLPNVHDDLFFNSAKNITSIRKLRWFLLPTESLLIQRCNYIPNSLLQPKPFQPIQFTIKQASQWFSDSCCCVHPGQSQNPHSIPSQLTHAWKKQFPAWEGQALENKKEATIKDCEFYPERRLVRRTPLETKISYDFHYTLASYSSGFEDDRDIINKLKG